MLVLVLCLSACATGLPHVERTVSQALPSQPGDRLREIAAAGPGDAALSGFRLLHTAAGAWHARAVLMRAAQRSIDAQYYQLRADRSGHLFVRELRDAARRGVRVRLLLDDLYTHGLEGLLQGLLLEPNVEIRLFNPFLVSRGPAVSRLLWSLHDFDRLHRRMHNKLLLIDSSLGVTGGRNIGDEYFMRSEFEYFFDLDVLVAGHVVPQLAALFDRHWNSDPAVPAPALLGSGVDEHAVRETFERSLSAHQETDMERAPPPDQLGQRGLGEDLARGTLDLHWGHAQAFADAPQKALERQRSIRGNDSGALESLADRLRLEIDSTQDELVLVSPYLIPSEDGLNGIEQARHRGVRVSVLTNSAASTDEPLAYGAYRRYRVDLLRTGVELYELSAALGRRSMRTTLKGSADVRLHTKCAVLDRRRVFIGSLNLDPRSRHFNTEMGLLIESEELAADVRQIVGLQQRRGAYRVLLAEDGRTVRWQWSDELGHRTDRAPRSLPWWRRFWLELLTPLVPEGLL